MSKNAARAAALIALSVAGPLAGCAAMRKTRPLDMSAAEHEQAARQATSRGKAQLAAAHADAARALRAAEDRACEGVTPLDVAPGFSGLEIVRTSKLERPLKFQKVTEGAAVIVAAEGRSFDAIERMMKCRSAHAAVTRDAADPLAIDGAILHVYRDDGDAVVVHLRSRDTDRAEEIFRRVARQVGAAPGDAGSTDRADPHEFGRPRDDGNHDPRTHVAEPSSPGASGGFAPVDGSIGGSRRP